MKNNLYPKLELRAAQRSHLRNLPESCMFCAYRLKPSSAFDSCSLYCKKVFKTDSVENNK